MPRPSAFACNVWVIVCIAWALVCWPCKICCNRVSRPSYCGTGCGAGCGVGCGVGCGTGCGAGCGAGCGTGCGTGCSIASISALVYPAIARAAFSLIFNFSRLHYNVCVMCQAFNDLIFIAFGERTHRATLPRVGDVCPVAIVADAQTSAKVSQQKSTLVCDRLGENDITTHWLIPLEFCKNFSKRPHQFRVDHSDILDDAANFHQNKIGTTDGRERHIDGDAHNGQVEISGSKQPHGQNFPEFVIKPLTHHAGIETRGRKGFHHTTDNIHTNKHQNGQNCINVHITSPPIQIQVNPRFLRWLTPARPFWGLPVGTWD
nr:MAG TPA_asm: hypothetical protein [Caudoviricetes sp.]